MSGNYAFDITVPANTAKELAIDTEIILSPGIIDEIAIGFPPGCSALARIQFLHENAIIFPSSPNNSYGWDDIVIEFNPRYLLSEFNSSLTLRTWNLDEFYDHTITIMINVVNQNPAEFTLNGFLSLMSKS